MIKFYSKGKKYATTLSNGKDIYFQPFGQIGVYEATDEEAELLKASKHYGRDFSETAIFKDEEGRIITGTRTSLTAATLDAERKDAEQRGRNQMLSLLKEGQEIASEVLNKLGQPKPDADTVKLKRLQEIESLIGIKIK